MRLALVVGKLAAVALLLSVGSPAWPKEKPHGDVKYKVTIHDERGEKELKLGPKEAAAYVAEGKVGHLALDEAPGLLALQWDLGLWTLVVFLLLFWILKKAAWGPILEGLQKREENILGAVEEARKARDDAQKLRTQLQGEMDKASAKVREILDEARRDAQHTTEEMIAKARSEIQTERDRLRREIETARDQALKELWEQSAQLATLISAKAIRRQLTPDDHRRLVDEALADLRQAGDDRRSGVAV